MPERIHYIVEWAKKRSLSQADICREIGADKGLVSRWFTMGILPKPEYLEKLAELFRTDIHGLFRHPDDDELLQIFRDKTEAQKAQALEILRILFRSQ